MAEPPIVSRVAAAVADGERISWNEVERLAATPDDARMIRQLRRISALTAAAEQPAAEPRWPLPRAIRIVLLLAAAQSLAAMATIPEGALQDAAFRPAQALLVAAFAAAALILWFGGRTDRRAQWLMAVYLFSSAAFAHPLLQSASGIAAAVAPLHWLALDALLPYALWRFAQVFPFTERFTWIDRAAVIAATVSLACGAALTASNLLLAWVPSLDGTPAALFGREHPSRAYWDVVYPLALAALVVPALRTWRAAPSERKRVRLFALAFVAGATPLLVKGVLEMAGPPALAAWMRAGTARAVIDALVFGALLLIPPATTYAVLVRQALPVRVVLHRATRYVLARGSVGALTLLPALALARYAYRHSDQPLARVVSEGDGRLLAAWLAVSLVLLAVRRPLVALVDRRFVGAARNPQRALAQSVQAIREANGAAAVAAAVAREIERVFGARAGVLQRTAEGVVPAYGPLPPIPASSAILVLADQAAEPFVVGTASRIHPLLPADDRRWIHDTRTDLILPLHDAAGRQVALVAAEAKTSGLAWTSEDLALLTTLGQAAGLAFGNALRHGADAVQADTPWATECSRCGRIGAAGQPPCACGAPVHPSLLPATLHGKFVVERRIGAGGMGVVYRGRDVALGRAVALKTLPSLGTGAAARMQDEARAMASRIHPNLALIFGAETWGRTPVLVMEFLEGGTLADRLRHGAMPPDDAVRLVRTLAGALAALHDGGLVHGDVKPSNIGFTREGTPKLLDFGLARLATGPDPLPAVAKPETGPDPLRAVAKPETGPDPLPAVAGPETGPDPGAGEAHRNPAVSRAGGTPLYLPPEAFEGAHPSPAFDTWALALVLFEAVAGQHPFAATTLGGVRRRIAAGRAPDVTAWCEGVPAHVARALAQALDADPRRRPVTVAAFAAMLDA